MFRKLGDADAAALLYAHLAAQPFIPADERDAARQRLEVLTAEAAAGASGRSPEFSRADSKRMQRQLDVAARQQLSGGGGGAPVGVARVAAAEPHVPPPADPYESCRCSASDSSEPSFSEPMSDVPAADDSRRFDEGPGTEPGQSWI